MQPGVPRGYQPPGNTGVLDFSRYSAPPHTMAGQGRPIGYPQGSFLEEQAAYGVMEDDWFGGRKAGAQTAAYSGAPPPGGYGPYLGAQTQAPPPTAGATEFGFQTSSEDFPALGAMGRPPVGQKPVETKASSGIPAATASGRTGHIAQPDLSRVLHAQPPPPPSQAPYVPPTQPPVPQGPPPSAPPLMSPPLQRPSEMSEEDRKKEEMLYLMTPEAERAAREKYGLLGILKVIRMTDPDLNTLALGMDLTTLGLNLNSPECLYATFASPWSDTPARKDPEFYLPHCYYMSPPLLKTAHLSKFSLETLFYIFFNMPKDTLQAYAAAELYNRGWKYHKDLRGWFEQTEEDGQHRWICFDPNTWDKQYYVQPLDPSNFLSEDDVRVKMPSSPPS